MVVVRPWFPLVRRQFRQVGPPEVGEADEDIDEIVMSSVGEVPPTPESVAGVRSPEQEPSDKQRQNPPEEGA